MARRTSSYTAVNQALVYAKRLGLQCSQKDSCEPNLTPAFLTQWCNIGCNPEWSAHPPKGQTVRWPTVTRSYSMSAAQQAVGGYGSKLAGSIMIVSPMVCLENCGIRSRMR
ncbi:hypothetical protein PGT21_014490 [Puccinia graminis f. sp. tritici]|uniref:Uncharacterized protein n=1 Tax=Puccinia graminis f. sp. tritici TaxID=56615 RepID=A0A5B0Q6B2_PUCGR|nr:hypothetical protein PGT21_014490 [Puccinia graminis f. sp. tritici]